EKKYYARYIYRIVAPNQFISSITKNIDSGDIKMIKSLLLAITLLTISTSGWACLPPPAWASGASEIRKIMSSVAVILDTSGKNTNIRVDSLSVEGVQA